MCVDNGVKETAVRLGQPETGGDNEPKCRNAAAGAAGSRITSVSTVRSSWNVDEETRHINVRIVTAVSVRYTSLNLRVLDFSCCDI